MINLMRRSIIGALALATLPIASANAQDTLEARIDAGSVTIGIHNRFPWGYRDESGEVAGFHPDLVREALEPLGITNFEFVITEFGALIPGLKAHRFDMIASGIAVTPERCAQVIFSEPDLSVVDGLLVEKGNPLDIHSYQDIIDNPDITLAGGRGTLNTKNALDAGVPEDQMIQFPSGQESLSAVMAGRADAATMSAPTVASHLRHENVAARLERAQSFTGLLREDGTPSAMYTAIAFRPDDTELRDAYDERLAEMKADGAVAEIMERYGFLPEDTAPERTTDEICSAS